MGAIELPAERKPGGMRAAGVQELEGLCNDRIILQSRVNYYLRIVAAAGGRSRHREAQMNIRRVFLMWWTLFSILFVAFVAVRYSNDLKREFEQASAQQQWIFERTKEKAAPLRFLWNLSVLAVGVPLASLGLGLALIWAAGGSTRSKPGP